MFVSFANFAQTFDKKARRKEGGVSGYTSLIFLTDGSPQVAKLSATDIRPSVHLPCRPRQGEARQGGGWLRGTESVSRRVSRGPTAVAGIARSHQCPPSPVARRRPPSVVPPARVFISGRASRLRHGGTPACRSSESLRAVPLPTRPPRRSITREEAPPTSPREYVAPVPRKSVDRHVFNLLAFLRSRRVHRDFSDQRFCGPTDPL